MKTIELRNIFYDDLSLGNPIPLANRNFFDSIKAVTPGEWCLFKNSGKEFFGFLNPTSKQAHLGYILAENKDFEGEENYIIDRIRKAVEKRLSRKSFREGGRLVYGSADGFPGVVVDEHIDSLFIQISVAGFDRHRQLIKDVLEKERSKSAFFVNNMKKRELENLPDYQAEVELPNEIKILENNIKFHLGRKNFQKLGFFYDQKYSRKCLKEFLFDSTIVFEKGVDLYSYAGGWGLTMLSCGVKNVDFVDTADMGSVIENNLKINDFENKGRFYQMDVKLFLDDCPADSYDLVIIDPPAFSKSKSSLKNARVGYQRLIEKSLKIVKNGGVFGIGSCTQQVGFNDLQEFLLNSCKKSQTKITCIGTAHQGYDHPFQIFTDKNFYLKFNLYSIEKVS